MDSKKLGDEDIDWFQVGEAGSNQERVVGFIEHCHELFNSEKASNILRTKR
jgi:hypothetical protein